ncbi:MAG TPA: hypothetical protein PK956_02185, partial [Burkholderiaceae bacterium]|nr:hypothetical protein [Burkholderiaceae bacterium]
MQTAVSCSPDEGSVGSAWPIAGASAPNSIAATTIQFHRRMRFAAKVIRFILHETIRASTRSLVAARFATTIRPMTIHRVEPDPDWLDREYNARAAIPDAGAIIGRWSDDATAVRRRCAGLYDIAYGVQAAERLDFFPAASPGAPLFVFLHGGYWRSL